jgi:hypothetical protein
LRAKTSNGAHQLFDYGIKYTLIKEIAMVRITGTGSFSLNPADQKDKFGSFTKREAWQTPRADDF